MNTLKNYLKIFLITFLFFTINLLLVNPAYAQTKPNSDPQDPGKQQVNTINIGDRLNTTNLGVKAPAGSGLVGTILKNSLSLLFIVGGIGTLVYFVWGAVDWILSGGDKEKVGSARKKLTSAIIGLVLLSLSYFIIGLVGDIAGFNPLQPIQIKSLGEP